MKRLILVFLMLLQTHVWAQKKDRFDITSNLEVRAIALKPLGNNTLAKDFKPFFGLGVGGQLMTPTNFGIGLDFNMLFSDVKYGKENIFGNLGSQKLTNVDLSLIHKTELSEDFAIEQFAGISFFRLHSTLYPGKEKYSEGRGGLNLGLKGVLTVDNEGTQQFVFGIKGNTYSSGVNNENKEIEKYYRQSFFLSFSFGYRYNF